MADLTRFDFHAVRFMNSESVERMTAEEVGQFLLLLCKSWLSGKAATIPDDLELLARYARGVVSTRVLSEFPIVDTEWGPRRRNRTLHGEWLFAIERSSSASERGKKGNQVRYSDTDSDSYSDSYSEANSTAMALAKGSLKDRPIISYQSYHTNHTNHTSQHSQGNFSSVKTTWRRLFKKILNGSKQNKQQYADCCYKYGEEVVLGYLEEWAKSNEWVSNHPRGENRLYRFLQDLPSMVEGDQMRATEESVNNANITENQISLDSLIAEKKAAHDREMEAERIKQESEAKFIEEHKFDIGS